MKNFALMFDNHMEWFSQQIIDGNANTTEMGRQFQAASEARIAFLKERIDAIEETVVDLEAEKRALIDWVQTEIKMAAATAAEIEASNAAMNAILEGPKDTDKAAA
jgi:hypothetical protein